VLWLGAQCEFLLPASSQTPQPVIRQQAVKLKVHPDSVDKCVDLFVKSAIYAGVAGEKDTDEIEILGTAPTVTAEDLEARDETESVQEQDKGSGSDSRGLADRAQNEGPKIKHVSARGNMNVSITLDSTMESREARKISQTVEAVWSHRMIP
jgi:hypothetical protein